LNNLILLGETFKTGAMITADVAQVNKVAEKQIRLNCYSKD
jgi:hypothetical protein